MDPQLLTESEAIIGEMIDYVDFVLSAEDGNLMPPGRKSDGSPVTNLDLDIEKTWREIIGRRFPGHTVAGEEFGGRDGGDRYCWYLDPIDGTDDLVRGIPLYGYLAAVTYLGQPIASAIGHPPLGFRATAVFGRGIKVTLGCVRLPLAIPSSEPVIAIPALQDFLRCGDRSSLFLELARQFPNHRTYRNVFAHAAVLTGALDAAVEINVAEWDVCATRLLVEEQKGIFVEFERMDYPDKPPRVSVVFGNPETVDRLLCVIKRHC